MMTEGSYLQIKVSPLAGALGAEITGVDLAAELADSTVAEIRRIGEPVEYPFVKGIDGFPEIIAVAKLPHETVNFGGIWHSDTVYLDRPPMATRLLAREIPPFTCRYRWSVGSLALWDNRATLHNPINDYHGYTRVMHRIGLAGDVPR